MCITAAKVALHFAYIRGNSKYNPTEVHFCEYLRQVPALEKTQHGIIAQWLIM